MGAPSGAPFSSLRRGQTLEYDSFVSEVKLEQACHDYLESLGYTQWANWNINDTERRKLAEAWLKAQVAGVLSFVSADEERDWRVSWQRSLILQRFDATLQRSRKLAERLRRLASRVVTSTSVLWTATRMSLRSSRPTASSSEFLRWIDSLVAMAEANSRLSRGEREAARRRSS